MSPFVSLVIHSVLSCHEGYYHFLRSRRDRCLGPIFWSTMGAMRMLQGYFCLDFFF